MNIIMQLGVVSIEVMVNFSEGVEGDSVKVERELFAILQVREHDWEGASEVYWIKLEQEERQDFIQ